MGKIIALIAAAIAFASVCIADTLGVVPMEITAPKGKFTVRVMRDEGLTEEVNLATPALIEARIRHDIRMLRDRDIQKLSRKDRIHAMAKLDELEDLTGLLCSYLEIPVDTVVRPTPMSDASFSSFITQLQKEGISDNKMVLIRAVAVQSYFTIDQVCQIMGYLPMDDDKVEVARVCYLKVIDKEDSFKLLNAVTFSESKDAISKIISK